jgi:Txe/YoeB family toxin of Txe-Axe toxin-antitoxin module
MLRQHPRYEPISHLTEVAEQRAFKEINEMAKQMERQIYSIEEDMEKLNDRKGGQFLNQILKQIDLQPSFDSFDPFSALTPKQMEEILSNLKFK